MQDLGRGNGHLLSFVISVRNVPITKKNVLKVLFRIGVGWAMGGVGGTLARGGGGGEFTCINP